MTSSYSTSPLTYAPVILGIIAGVFIENVDRGDLSWVSNICYVISALALFVFLKGHKTVLITKETIEISYLLGREEIIKKSEVESCEKKSEYARRGQYRVTYTFYMKGDSKIELGSALLSDEKGAKAAIDAFTSSLQMKSDL